MTELLAGQSVDGERIGARKKVGQRPRDGQSPSRGEKLLVFLALASPPPKIRDGQKKNGRQKRNPVAASTHRPVAGGGGQAFACPQVERVFA